MPSDPVSAGPRGDLPGVDRLLALSDGVVAIAITLLVLQLNVPSPAKLADPNSAAELAVQLRNGADRMVSYVISFYVIAQFWPGDCRDRAGNAGGPEPHRRQHFGHRLVHRHRLGESRRRQVPGWGQTSSR
jgi:Endosomal/lysosomal potassium channel TMEM175